MFRTEGNADVSPYMRAYYQATGNTDNMPPDYIGRPSDVQPFSRHLPGFSVSMGVPQGRERRLRSFLTRNDNSPAELASDPQQYRDIASEEGGHERLARLPDVWQLASLHSRGYTPQAGRPAYQANYQTDDGEEELDLPQTYLSYLPPATQGPIGGGAISRLHGRNQWLNDPQNDRMHLPANQIAARDVEEALNRTEINWMVRQALSMLDPHARPPVPQNNAPVQLWQPPRPNLAPAVPAIPPVFNMAPLIAQLVQLAPQGPANPLLSRRGLFDALGKPPRAL